MGRREHGRRAFLAGAVGVGAGEPALGSGASLPGLDTRHEVRWTLDAETEEAMIFPVDRTRGTVVAVVRAVGDGGRTYTVHALDAETGDRRWTRELDGHSTLPRAAGGRVYLGDGEKLLALDAADGSEQWRLSWSGVEYRNVAVGDRAVVAVRGARVTAVNDAGEERWTTEVRNNGRLGSPALADDRVYLGGERGFYALDAETGRERWFAEVPRGEATWVGGVRDGLLVGWSDAAAYGLRVADGTRRWRTPHGPLRPHGTGGALAGDAVYLWGETLAALNVRTGEKRWTFAADDGRGYAPAVGGGSVHFPVSNGDFVAVDADSGRERWRVGVGALNAYWGGVADGLVYLVGESEAYAFDAETGRERWTLDLGDEQGFWADVSGDAAFVATRGGTLYAVDRPSPLATAPVATAEEFAASPPGTGLLGLLVAGLVGAGYLGVERWTGKRDADDAPLGRLERLDAGPVTERYRKRVETPDGTRLVVETRLTDDADPETRRAFARAVRRWADLDADGVLPVREYDIGPDAETGGESAGTETESSVTEWFETPSVAGGSLAEAWPVARRDRIEVASGVARTLHAAHREGAVHGRLAPRHVRLDSAAGGARGPGIAASDVLVGGWFVAAALADARDADDPYAPPDGASDGSVRGDVYRVAALAYHLLTGTVPDPDPVPASSRNAALSEELDEVLARALSADPDDRYGTALAFDDAFRWAAIER